MSDFAAAIAEWQTFYVLTGTAAATLIGLLFVAISIHLDVFHRQAYQDLMHFAALTFNCFFYVLVISILFLIPRLPSLGLGMPLFFLGGLGLANAVLQQRRAQRAERGRKETGIASRFTLPAVSFGALSIIGLCASLGILESLYGLVIVVILLLGSASVNAWTLLMRADDQQYTGQKQ